MTKRKPIKFQDVRGSAVTTARYQQHEGYRPQMGRSSVVIVCPFCQAHVTAFLWSIAGGGKRCKCGALFGSRGQAYQWSDLVANMGVAVGV
jgi:hypothetical protein